MFDINTIVNAAIAAAVQQAIAPLLDQIHNLDAICQTQHEGMVAMRDRITALENQAIVTSNAVDARIAVLENNPAQGVEPAITIDEARMVEALNSQEWFWEKLHNTINDNVVSRVEEALDEHCSNYDHDDYDSAVSKVDDLPDLDDYVTRDEVRSEIEDVLNNATLSLSV